MKISFLTGILLGILAAYIVVILSSYWRTSGNPGINTLELGVGGSAPTPLPSEAPSVEVAENNDMAVLAQKGNFKVLIDALNETGLADKVSGPGDYTVFAPTDDAFSKIPRELLYALLSDPSSLKIILMHHIINGNATAEDLRNGAKTLDGTNIKVTDSNGVKVDGYTVKDAIKTSNGTIYVIDDLLLPPDYLLKTPEKI